LGLWTSEWPDLWTTEKTQHHSEYLLAPLKFRMQTVHLLYKSNWPTYSAMVKFSKFSSFYSICERVTNQHTRGFLCCKKLKFFLLLDMIACWRSRGIAPLILNLSSIWRWGVNITPWPLYPIGGEGTKYADWGPWARIRNTDCPARSLVTIPTALTWLSFSMYSHIVVWKNILMLWC